MYDIEMSKDFPEELHGELVTSLQEVQRRLAEKREAEKRDDPGRESTEQGVGGSVEPRQVEREVEPDVTEQEVEPDAMEREGELTIDEGQQSQTTAGIRIGGSIQYNLLNILTAEEDEELKEGESTPNITEPTKPKTGPGGLRRARRIDPTVDDIKARQQRALKAAIDQAMEQGHYEEAELMRAKQVPETPSVFSDIMAASVEQESRKQEECERESTLAAMETEEETAERHRREIAMIEQQEKERQAAERERQDELEREGDEDDDYGDDNEDEYYDDNDDNGGQLGQSFVQEKRREWNEQQQQVKTELDEPWEEPIEEPINEPTDEPENQGEDDGTVNTEVEPQPGTSGDGNSDGRSERSGCLAAEGRCLGDDERTELEED